MISAGLLLTVSLRLSSGATDGGPDASVSVPAPAPFVPPKVIELKTFGNVEVTLPKDPPIGAVVLVSGVEGWGPVLADSAKRLSSSGYLVLGVDIRHYLTALESKHSCAYPGGDLAALSQYAQKRLRIAHYLRPVLVGEGAGASLVYAALAQAPDGTFRGAASLGFCPELAGIPQLCEGNGLQRRRSANGRADLLMPSRSATGWRVLQGEKDRVCPLAHAQAFVAQVPGAGLLSIPTLEHRTSNPERVTSAVFGAVEELSSLEPSWPRPPAPPEAVDDLPLIEVPAMGAGGHDLMALMVSGDGGWAGLERTLAQSLNVEGIPVLGWSSLSYFWEPRTPDETAKDLARAARHYLRTWKKPGLVLIGYSGGADAIPAAVARWSEDLRQRLRLIVLVGPGSWADFEVRGAEAPADGREAKQYPVLPELAKLGDLKVLCVYGDEEKGSLCSQLKGTKAVVARLKGDQRFGGDYSRVTREIQKAIP